ASAGSCGVDPNRDLRLRYAPGRSHKSRQAQGTGQTGIVELYLHPAASDAGARVVCQGQAETLQGIQKIAAQGKAAIRSGNNTQLVAATERKVAQHQAKPRGWQFAVTGYRHPKTERHAMVECLQLRGA